MKRQRHLYVCYAVAGILTMLNAPATIAQDIDYSVSPAALSESSSDLGYDGNGCCADRCGGCSGGCCGCNECGGCCDAGCNSCGGCGCDSCWTPLCLRDLGYGWFEPFAAAPAGSGGAPRQGWLNTRDGFFTKEWHLFYGYADGPAGGPHTHLGLYQFQYPLSRRFWVGLDVPFVVATRGSAINEASDFGDLVVTPKILLLETRNVSLSMDMSIRTPTGVANTGGGISSLAPGMALFTDIGGGWSLRGGFNVLSVQSGGAIPDSDFIYNVALGQTITPADAAPLGDFTYYLSLNGRTSLDRGPTNRSIVTLTPGLRTRVIGNWFLLGALEVPLGHTRPFNTNALFMVVKGI